MRSCSSSSSISKKQHSSSPYGLSISTYALHSMMLLSVGPKNPVGLPSRYCDADYIHHTVDRLNPPFSVHPQVSGKKKPFSVRTRVFLSVEGLSIECENENELHFACKLVAMDHNRWQQQTNCCDERQQQDMDETAAMEAEAKARMEAPIGEEDFLPEELVDEEEDISIDEWSQMGYKWFKKEDVVYL